VELIDLGEMKRELERTRHPIMPLIRCFLRGKKERGGGRRHE
jgi:hypothetical protein